MSIHIWWYLSRACGMAAWLLALASVLWGLLLSTRALGKMAKGPWLLDLHRYLGALACAFTAVHVGALAFDHYAPFSVLEMLVPFAARWNPGAVAWGIAAMYALVVVEASSLVMDRLPRRLWHGIHLLSAVVYGAATVHLLMAGTDVDNGFVRDGVQLSVVVVILLVGWRLADVRRAKLATEREEKMARARAAAGGGTSGSADASSSGGANPGPGADGDPARDERRAKIAAAKAARAAQTAPTPPAPTPPAHNGPSPGSGSPPLGAPSQPGTMGPPPLPPVTVPPRRPVGPPRGPRR